MKKTSLFRVLFLCIVCALSGSSTAQIQLTNFQPENNKVNVPLNQNISFTFNTALDTSSHLTNINGKWLPVTFFSNIENFTSASISADRRTVTLVPQLTANKPYFFCVSSAAGLSSTRLATPGIFYFSTSSVFPQYKVSGTLTSSVSGVTVENSIVGLLKSDFDITSSKYVFEYMTVADAQGNFVIPHVATPDIGMFMILGLKDLNQNNLFNHKNGDVLAFNFILMNDADVENVELNYEMLFLESPTLLTPTDNSINLVMPVTLTWSHPKNTVQYWMQVALDSSFSTVVADTFGLDKTSWTLSNLAPSTKYYWKGYAFDNNGGGSSFQSEIFRFTTSNGLPPAPILKSPENGITGQPRNLYLDWELVHGAISYTVQVSKSQTFTANILDTIITDGSTSVYLSDLPLDTKVYWRVKAKNTSGDGPFSVIWNFTTFKGVPGIVTLVAPGNNEQLSKNEVDFEWQTILDATEYRIQISKSQNFSTIDREDIGSSNTYKAYSLIPNTKFYWRVRAENEVGPGNWSSVRSFTTWRAPDLVVTKVTAPSSSSSGKSIQVTYAIKNSGAGVTTAANWKDAIYLQPDTTFNANNAEFLLATENLSALNVNESYEKTVEVMLPEGIGGKFYIYVLTDKYSSQVELSDSNNTGRSLPINISLTPPPDLMVSALTVPSQTYNGKKIPLSFTIKNWGPGATPVSEWLDYVYISKDSIFSDSAIYLNSYSHSGILQKDGTYTINDSVTIPHAIFGKQFIYVFTDKSNKVYEHAAETNNINRSNPMQVLVVSAPDLAVTKITLPNSAGSGEKINLSWTVKNQGPSETVESWWQDRLYLSKEQTLNTKTAYLLGTFNHYDILSADSSYTFSDSVVLPNGISGNYNLFVVTDWNNKVFEYTFEDNNTTKSSHSVSISLTPSPDFQVTDAVIPSNLIAGASAHISYTVKNAGSGKVNATSWSDRIYISADPVWNAVNSILIADLKVSKQLDAQGTYTQDVITMLPVSLTSSQYIHVVTDFSNTVFENTAENNNVKSSDQLSIRTYPPADYNITVITAPQSCNSGRLTGIEWTVKNTGNIAPIASSWYDNVYLSTDNHLSDNDILLLNVQNSNPLKPNTSYTRKENINIPGGTSGSYYLIIKTDVKGSINDANTGNNIKATDFAITITSLPAPELMVSSVTVPAQLFSNQPANIQWIVKNNGPGNTAELLWTDIVYLSTDTTIDNYDNQLGFRTKNTTLNVNGTYSENLSVEMPNRDAGTYYLLIKTDAKGEVYEGNESNNVKKQLIQLSESPMVDLIVQTISSPVSAQTGDEINVSYSLKNISSNKAEGRIFDAVYISQDNKWDYDDPLLGINSHSISIIAGGTFSATFTGNFANLSAADENGNVTGTVPGLMQGSYYIIVKTNIKKSLPEITDTNNVKASTTSLNVTLPTLSLGVIANSAITNKQPKYYKIPGITAGKTLKITVTCNSEYANNELFARYGVPPSAGEYDYVTVLPSPNQEIIIPETKAGDYYAYLRDRSLGNLDTNKFTLKAEYIEFSISQVMPNKGGNTGEVTVSVHGARFDSTCVVSLVNKDNKKPVVINKKLVDASTIDVTFDMMGTDLPLGQYDVIVKKSNNTEVKLVNGFTLEPGRPLDITMGYAPPSAILRGGAGNITLNFQNTSNVDLPFMNGVILMPRGQKFSIYSDKLFKPDTLFGDTVLPESPEYFDDDDWRVVPLFAKGIRPGEIVNVYVQAEDVQGDEFPFQAFALALDRKTFIDDQLQYLEILRQSLLADSVRLLNPELFQLAQFPARFFNEVLKSYVAAGLLTENDIRNLQLDNITLKDACEVNSSEDNVALYKTSITSCEKAVMWATVAVKVAFGVMKIVLVPVTMGGAIIFVAKTVWSVASTYHNIKVGKPSWLAKLICKYIPVIASKDPNDISGPEGYGPDRWVSVSQTLPYTIRFENDPKLATAPAQVVTITQKLDDNVDPKSFRLGNFGFGSFRFNVPSNASFFTQRADVKDSLKVLVDFEAGIDLSTNTAFWTLKSVDPATGQLPINPLLGFLSINDSLHHGEGFVSYTVKPKSTAKTLDKVNSKASIVFDKNAPIETPAIFNTIDAGLPVSKVNNLDATSRTHFNVGWTGNDDSTGSGLQSFSVYVSKDNEPYKIWISDVDDLDSVFAYYGIGTYKFYSIARDNAGNFEASKLEADATTMVTDVEKDIIIPKEYSLGQNYPNPFNPTTTIKYELPVTSNVTLRIYNILGELVRTVKNEVQEAGVYTVKFEVNSLASGVYLYELRSQAVSGEREANFVKKMMILK